MRASANDQAGRANARVVGSYALSPTQEGMLFHGLLGEATGVDVEQIVCTIRGRFDEQAFVAAFHEVASRHAVLRTRFVYDDVGRPVQEVVESATIPVERLDATTLESSEPAARLEEMLRRDRVRGVVLGRAPAMRLTVMRWFADEHRVLWTFHHALLDGRSFPLVLREVVAFYGAAVTGRDLDLPVPRAYREYIEFLATRDLAAAEAYWRTYLAGIGAPTPLAIDHAATDDPAPAAVQGVTERRLPRHTTTALRALADSRGVTLNTVLQAAWAVVLQRYSRETDVVFGTTRACRRSTFPDAHEMVGLFINTLPLRVRVDPEGSLPDLLDHVRAVQVELREHEHTPLVRVQGWSEIPRGRPLFDTLVVYEDRTLDAGLGSLDVPGARLEFSYRGQTNYPVTLVAYGDDEMLIRLEHDRRRVDDAPASRMLGHLLTVLSAMPDHADRPLAELPWLTERERTELVAIASAPACPAGRCLHERFEERVAAAPDQVAAVCDGESLTYGELDRRANALAWELRSLGVGPEVLVGIRTERSLEIVVGILAIHKAGGAYLPLDPAYPKDRVEFMLADSAVRVVVTEAVFAGDFSASEVQLVLLDGAKEASQGPRSGVTATNLAYVIYTSGSTGRPKGVLVTHHNVGRLFEATTRWFAFGPDDVWTLFHSYAFDFSVWELWGALLHGGRLVVVPYWVSRSPEAFRELLLDEGVTVLNQTPSAFRQLVQADARSGPPGALPLRYVIFGGEALELSSLRPWFERHGDRQPQLVNMYGITETTVHVTCRPVCGQDLEAGAGSVIGVPLSDLWVLLLDAHGAAVPTGVPGEMYVGGGGVARGYLGRPELTAQRFVPDPSPGGDQSTLYRTGDLARRLENGELEYLGRIDDQVKIRGFRIELGEVEAVLEASADVSDVAVVVREDAAADKRLVAYMVGDGDTGALVENARIRLAAKLPEYMVPAHIVVLASLPLTPNGKLDRDALPAPQSAPHTSDRPYTAPRTPTEETLAGIWAAVLGAPRVGVDDNFFELGGDSILTIQVIVRSRQAGLHFTPRDLAKAPSIAQLSNLVGSATAATEKKPVHADGPVAPTPIQRWFFEQRLTDPNHWNQAFLFELPAGVDVEVLEQALGRVVAHHDALRLRWAGQGPSETLSYAASAAALPMITRLDLTQLAPQDHAVRIEQAAGTVQSQLDLRAGPVLAALHVDRGPAPGRLLLAAHHLVVDGVSWRIIVEDLETAYRALSAGSPVGLPAASDSFRAWSQALTEYAATPAPGSAAGRWRDIEAVPGNLPGDAAGGGRDVERQARSATVSLDVEETRSLLQQVPAAYRTQINDVLLTAVALALRAWTGRESHRIELEGHGREEWVADLDLSRTVGWFTSLYPVALDLAGARDEGSALKLVKEALRQVPDRGLSYGVLRYAASDPAVREKLGAQQPADLLFNYLGQFDQVVAGSELFRFADEGTGAWHGPANERTHRLEVVAVVRDGRFEARWIFGAERDRPEVVERLADGFIAALRSVIEHCTISGASGCTPSDFPLAGLGQQALDALVARHADLEDVYPLSPMQRLFLSMEGGGERLGFEQWVFRIRGPLDPTALHNAWKTTVARHTMLRTAFDTQAAAEPLQVVKRRVEVPWAQEDWTSRPPADAHDALDALLRADRERGFDVGVAPLSRVTLVRLADHEHRLVWSTHHLYVDGWSWPLIFRDVGAAYEAELAGTEPRLAAPGQFRAYVEWLAGRTEGAREFWKDALATFSSPTPLPRDPMPAQPAAETVCESAARLDAPTTAALTRRARALGVTLSTVVQGAWAVLLSHLSERDEVVFGAAFSGRPPELDGVETLVGPCVNNVPISVRLDRGQAVSDWLAALHERTLEIAQHQYAALSDIQEWAGVPWRLRLFDSLVVFQNYLVDDAVLRWGDVRVEPIEAPEATNYPLTLTVTPATEIEVKLRGRAELFTPAALTMMLDGMVTVLGGLAERDDAPLSEIVSLLPASTQGAAARASATVAPRRQATYVAPGNETERAVADVWAELFQVDEVGMDDNFFDLGGHSILLLQAHARLRERVRDDLPVVALLQYPTVRSLAAYLSNGATANAALGAVQDRAKRQRQALARQRSLQGRR